MKTIKHEIKLEKSVKIILCILAVGVFLNAFATPIGKELFATKDANAFGQGPIHRIAICNFHGECGYSP